LFPELSIHAAFEHLDRRRLHGICQMEADDFGGLALRRVVEAMDRHARRLEEAVARREMLLRFALDVKDEAALGDDATGRDRVPVKPGGLAGRETDARALHQAHRRVRRRQAVLEHRLASKLGVAALVHGSIPAVMLESGTPSSMGAFPSPRAPTMRVKLPRLLAFNRVGG